MEHRWEMNLTIFCVYNLICFDAGYKENEGSEIQDEGAQRVMEFESELKQTTFVVFVSRSIVFKQEVWGCVVKANEEELRLRFLRDVLIVVFSWYPNFAEAGFN